MAKLLNIGTTLYGISESTTDYRFDGAASAVESNLGINPGIMFNEINARKLNFTEISLELFQRVRFVGGGMLGKGVHWDLGAYVSYGWYEYAVRYNKISHAKVGSISINDPSYQDNYKVNFGLTTRFTYMSYPRANFLAIARNGESPSRHSTGKGANS